MARVKRKKKDVEKAGGLAYVLSLVSLMILSFSNSWAILSMIEEIIKHQLLNLVIIAVSMCLGFLLTLLCLPEHLFVFMHETKHALVSGLAGNKWKNMKVGSYSGHFEYAYSKSTAHFNAMISLAPYFFPLVTIPSILLAFAALYPRHEMMVALVCFAYGVDLFSNIKDVDPRQSDFYSLRGGFQLALIYVIAANTFIISLITIWGLFGASGFKMLLFFFFEKIKLIVGYFHQPI